MRKASFSCVQWVGYDSVPVPDNIADRDLIQYLLDNIEDFETYKDKNVELSNEVPIYQVIVEREDESEYTVTIDD